MNTNNILKRFGQRVKSLRLEKGWSQEELAEFAFGSIDAAIEAFEEKIKNENAL